MKNRLVFVSIYNTPYQKRGRFFLLFRCLRRPAVLILRQIIILSLDDPALSFGLRDIQMCQMKSVLCLHPLLDFFVCSLTLCCRNIQFIHIQLDADMMLCFREFGQYTYRLDVARGNKIDTYIRCLFAQSGKRTYLRGFCRFVCLRKHIQRLKRKPFQDFPAPEMQFMITLIIISFSSGQDSAIMIVNATSV